MRKAKIYNHNALAGELHEVEINKKYKFHYFHEYNGDPISLTMPIDQQEFNYNSFPPFFEGLLPEGITLENLLHSAKIDSNDHFAQLIYVGEDLVGSVTVENIE